jgi:hypothetical protein
MKGVRAAVVRTAAVVLLAGLAACSDAEDDYCDALTAEQEELTELAARESGDVLTPTAEAFERLQAAAPDELRDEWDTVVGAYEVLVGTIQDVGVDPADYDADDPPDDVTPDEERRLVAAASALESARVTDAIGGIEEHAGTVCEVSFSG